MAKRYWLMKSEPETFGIADLERVRIEPWSGVRSFFARQHLRAMSVGDEALFHHSSVTPPGVAGLARIVRTNVVDETQFDPASPYYEPKATREQPIWDCVDVEFVERLPYFVTMDRMRAEPALSDMLVLRRGMRLSVQPCTEAEYQTIVRLGHTAPPAETPEPPRVVRKAPANKASAKKAPVTKAPAKQASKGKAPVKGTGKAIAKRRARPTPKRAAGRASSKQRGRT